MCSWQQETASLAGGLFSNPSLGSSSGHPAAAKKARQGAEDDIKLSHADMHVSKHRQMTSTLPRTDARHAVAQPGSENSSGQPRAEVAKAGRKRAAHTSFAEPAAKRLLRGENSSMQLTGATTAALGGSSHGQDNVAAAVPTSGDGGSSARAAQHGSGTYFAAAEMTEGEAGGRRRVVKVRKGRALQLLKDECDQGDEGFQAMEVC